MKLSERKRLSFEQRLLALELDNTVLEKSRKDSDEQVTLLTTAYLRMNTILKTIVAKCPTARQLFLEAEIEMAAKGLLSPDAKRRPDPAATATTATHEAGDGTGQPAELGLVIGDRPDA